MSLNGINEWDVIKRPHVKEINPSKKLVIFGLGDFAKACEKALKKKGYKRDGGSTMAKPALTSAMNGYEMKRGGSCGKVYKKGSFRRQK